VHVLDAAPDLSGGEGADAGANYEAIERELAAHDERLAGLPRVLALAKIDLLTPKRVARLRAEWERRLGPQVPVIATSSATGAGVRELGELLLARVPAGAAVAAAPGEPVTAPASAAGFARAGEEELAEHMVFRPRGSRAGFEVRRLGEGAFAVSGRGVERLVARYDLENADALSYLEGRLRRIGVLDALEREGFVPGDEVRIGEVSFELHPDAPG
jgi:GTP-binding protein